MSVRLGQSKVCGIISENTLLSLGMRWPAKKDAEDYVVGTPLLLIVVLQLDVQ
jgi:hypothetical protein